jgi:hypothetical protein
MGMKQATLIRCLLIMGLVFLAPKPLTLNAVGYQSKIPVKMPSCSEIKKLYPALEKLSHGELKKYLYEKFLSQYRNNPMETYTHIKYYLCRFPNEKGEQVAYMKKWVAAFEKKLKEIGDR